MSLSRSRGCLLGLAIRDALGAPVEFSPPGSFQPVRGYRAGGVFDLEAGQWTDDTGTGTHRPAMPMPWATAP